MDRLNSPEHPPIDRFDSDARDERTRVRWSLRPGAKVTSLIAASLLAGAVYYLFAPVFMQTGSGWFPCGTVVFGTDDDFTTSTCRGATNVYLAKALLSAALALIIGLGGAILFGVDPFTERRKMSSPEVDIELSRDRDDVEGSRDRPSRPSDAGRHKSDDGPRERRRGADQEPRSGSDAKRPRRARRSDAWEDDGWR